ncbi:MAG: hypothetical protein R3F43_06610 [bacterium]
MDLRPISTLTVRQAREALVRSVPTIGHATDVFEAVEVTLGDAGYVDPDGGDTRRVLFPRDGEGWLVPRALIQLDADDASAATPRDDLPRITPRRLPGRGRLILSDGIGRFEVGYDDRGLKYATVSGGSGIIDSPEAEDLPYRIDPRAVPPTPRPLGLLCRPDLPVEGVDRAVLVDWIMALDVASVVPARVWLPVPVTGGVDGVARVALDAIRRDLFAQSPPPGARFAIADGLTGEALAFGATEEEAFAAWQRAVWRIKPRRPDPKPVALPPLPPPTPPREGERVEHFQVVVSARPSFVPPATPTPETTPALRVPLPGGLSAVPPTYAAAGFTRRVLAIDPRGALVELLERRVDDTALLVNALLADRVDPARLERDLAAATEAALPWIGSDRFAEHGRRLEVRGYIRRPDGQLQLTQQSFSFGGPPALSTAAPVIWLRGDMGRVAEGG